MLEKLRRSSKTSGPGCTMKCGPTCTQRVIRLAISKTSSYTTSRIIRLRPLTRTRKLPSRMPQSMTSVPAPINAKAQLIAAFEEGPKTQVTLKRKNSNDRLWQLAASITSRFCAWIVSQAEASTDVVAKPSSTASVSGEAGKGTSPDRTAGGASLSESTRFHRPATFLTLQRPATSLTYKRPASTPDLRQHSEFPDFRQSNRDLPDYTRAGRAGHTKLRGAPRRDPQARPPTQHKETAIHTTSQRTAERLHAARSRFIYSARTSVRIDAECV